MIKYWITGVLKERASPDETPTFTDVAWSGPMTKVVCPFAIADWNEEGYRITVDEASPKPYGYSNHRWAYIALRRLVSKGLGFTPLLNVSEMQVRVVDIRADGSMYLLKARP